MTVEIRLLTADDWAVWRAMRLESLTRDPSAFGSSLAEEQARDESTLRTTLTNCAIHAVFVDGQPVGVAGVFRPDQRPKRRHRGTLFGVYLRAENRGAGLADALIGQVVAHAKADYRQLQCTVVVGNDAARRLYERHGFRVYAVDPGSLMEAGGPVDENLMVCDL